MASSTKTAIFFIILFAGHEVAEGARVHRHRVAVHRARVRWTDAEAEKVWQDENNECNTKWGLWCSKGQHSQNSASVTQCASQPLSRDRTPWSKCRVTDAWMLEGTEKKPVTWWVRLQNRVLSAKTAKFSKDCTDGYLHWATGLCRRRLGHILRAAKFISKASTGNAMEKLTTDEQEEVRESATVAHGHLASMVFSGEGAQQKKLLLQKLVDATRADQKGLENHPKDSAKRMLEVVQELFEDGANTTAAEDKIRSIQLAAAGNGDANLAVHEDVENITATLSPVEINAMLDGAVQAVEDKASDAENAATHSGQNGTSLADLQAKLQVDTIWADIVKVLVVILVIHAAFVGMAVVATWALVVIPLLAAYCLVYIAIDGDDGPHHLIPCMANYISRPFKYVASKLNRNYEPDYDH